MTAPLVDLHRHLDGNVRLETILDLGDRHGIELPAHTVEGLRPHVQVDGRERGLMAFIGRFRYLTAVLVDAEACRRVARENVEDGAGEGLAYLELRFSPWFMAETHGLELEEVVAAVVDGVESGSRELGFPVGLIGILSRTYGVEAARRELAALLAHRDHLVALDLAGDEGRFPPALFRDHFAQARDAGLAVTVHAGEVAGPESIWSAIEDLGAQRIGHGLRAGEDPRLVDYLIEHRIGLEVSLTSNVHTSSIADYSDHPLAEYLDRGILAAICTDDPVISGIDLRHELEIAAPLAGLSPEQIALAQRHAVEMAFVSDAVRARIGDSGPTAAPE